MTTRGRKRKQEQIKNSNHHKSLENLSPNYSDSNPEYLDYLKEIQTKNKTKKNGKKP